MECIGEFTISFFVLLFDIDYLVELSSWDMFHLVVVSVWQSPLAYTSYNVHFPHEMVFFSSNYNSCWHFRFYFVLGKAPTWESSQWFFVDIFVILILLVLNPQRSNDRLLLTTSWPLLAFIGMYGHETHNFDLLSFLN